MAFSLSPGITVSEQDLTNIVPAVGTTVGAIAGPFRWGPVGQITMVQSEQELKNTFLTPDNNCATTWFTAASFLAYAGALQVVRVYHKADTGGHLNATSDGTGKLIPNLDTYTSQYANGSGNVGLWAAKYPGDMGNSLYVSIADSVNFATWQYKNYFQSAPGTSSFVSNAGGSNDEVHVIVIDAGGKFTGTPGTMLETFPFASKCATAKGESGRSIYYANVINNTSNYIWWMDHPTASQLGLTGATTVNWGGNETTTFQGCVTSLTLTNITGGPFTVGEVVKSENKVVITDGAGTGATATVTSVDPTTGAILTVSPSAGGSGYTSPTVAISGAGSGAVVNAVLGTGAQAGQIVSFTVTNGGTGYFQLTGTVISWNSPTLDIAPTLGKMVSGLTIDGQTSNGKGDISAVAGGNLGSQLAGGVDANAALVDGDYLTGYDFFQSAANVDISLLLSADASPVVAEYLIQDIAEERLDCVTFISPRYADVVNQAGNEASNIVTYRNMLPSSSYAVMDSGWKYMYDKYNDVYRWIPLNGDIAVLCANTDNVADAWWSPAGYNRGNVKNVVKLAYNPGKADRDTLYNVGINPVISQAGQGTVLFGDKTLLSKPSAFDRINVRRLFIVLEKSISTAAKYTLFEFNDVFTQAQFVNMVTPYLQQIKGRRGITDFKVVCDSTNNPPQVVDSNQFVGDIYVKPARSINFIQLNFVAVATGVQFSEVVGSIG